jgi:hypothetical protein
MIASRSGCSLALRAMCSATSSASAWQLASSYYSGADCELAERDLVDTARLYPNVIGFYTLCIASDDPRLMER